MIHKSYLVEENLDILRNNLVLIYGENKGLINDLKNKILHKYKENKILKFNQEEILSNENLFFNEIKNISLFDNKKIYFIYNVNDKFIKILDAVFPLTDNNIVFIYADILDKKSKLRNFIEKKKDADVIPCYEDNEVSIKKIIIKGLKGYDGLNNQIISLITENCGNDRIKVRNEVNKITTYFNSSPLNAKSISKLLNYRQDEQFNFIKDFAISGMEKKTGELLNSTIIDSEKIIYYLSIMNHRLLKLKDIVKNKTNIEQTINNIKPPIFWKDKSTFLFQAKIWNTNKLNKALIKTYEAEIKLKSNTNINKNIFFKNLIIDICNLANAA